jgi:hypothetical protein
LVPPLREPAALITLAAWRRSRFFAAFGLKMRAASRISSLLGPIGSAFCGLVSGCTTALLVVFLLVKVAAAADFLRVGFRGSWGGFAGCVRLLHVREYDKRVSAAAILGKSLNVGNRNAIHKLLNCTRFAQRPF